jgi:hypothetical protein
MKANELLAAMKWSEVRPSGICIRGQWIYLVGGEPVTRAVNTLKRRGLVEGHYMSGGRAAINLTDAGRAA